MQAQGGSGSTAHAVVANSSEEETPSAIPLPDQAFLIGLVRRNWFVAAMVFMVLLPVGVYLYFQASAVYVAEAFIHYEYDDDLDFNPSTSRSAYTALLSVLTFLNSKTKDLEFLSELAAAIGEAPSPLEKLPFPPSIKNFLLPKKSPRTPASQVAAAKDLMLRISLAADPVASSTTSIIKITGSHSTPQMAKKTANMTAEAMISAWYAEEIRKVESASVFANSLLKDGLVQQVVTSPSDSMSLHKKQSDDEATRQQAELRKTRFRAQERMRELNEELTAIKTKRTKLTADSETLALTYGPHHPKLVAVQRELAELNKQQRDKQIVSELRSLGESTLDGDGVAARETSSYQVDAVRIIQTLPMRINLFDIQKTVLRQQLMQPEQRRIFTILSKAEAPLLPFKSNKKKMLMLWAGATAGLVLALVILREFFSDRVKDAWPVCLRLKAPCITTIPPRVLKKHDLLEISEIRASVSELAESQRTSRARGFRKISNPIVYYRNASFWIHGKSLGKVTLLLKSYDRPSRTQFIANLLNVYATDYAGRVLLIDLDTHDPVEGFAASPDANFFTLLQGKSAWRDICLPRTTKRAFDLVPPPATLSSRGAELLSAKAFAEVIGFAEKNYAKVFITGMGLDLFVENAALLTAAADSLVIVERDATRFSRMRCLKKFLVAKKLMGIAYLPT